MRILPLEVYDFAGSLRIMAHFLLTSENPHIFTFIKAIVDTGSPNTLISPVDMKKMRLSKIQLNKLAGRHKPVNIGGGQIHTKVLEDAKIRMGEDFEIKMPVEFPIQNEDSSIPSLLGVDFMLKTKARLIFDPSNRKAYFEIED